MALARACYTQSDIALLDDPLSAVDAHVGAHIFQSCVCGLLSDRTRILATHQMQYLPAADWVVVMEAGHISHQGRCVCCSSCIASMQVFVVAASGMCSQMRHADWHDDWHEACCVVLASFRGTGSDDNVVQCVSRLLYFRYENLVAEGVPLQQARMPSNTSFSNISSASQDIAPDTPHRSPTHPPSPTRQVSHTATGSSNNAAQQREPDTEQAGSPSTEGHAVVEVDASPEQHMMSNADPTAQPDDESSEQKLHGRQLSSTYPASSDIEMQMRRADASSQHTHSQADDSQRAAAASPQTLTLNSAQTSKSQSQASDLPSSPLLASSNGTLLSDKLADASQLLSQDSMLRNHQEEQSDALTAGLSKGALQTGFRAAGKVSITDGTSEPVTEALEALSPADKGPDEGTGAVDGKGRLMKASWHTLTVQTLHNGTVAFHALLPALVMLTSGCSLLQSAALSSDFFPYGPCLNVSTHALQIWICSQHIVQSNLSRICK